MSTRLRLLVTALLAGVMIGAIYLPGLIHRVAQVAHPPRTEEQSRREVVQPPIATPTDVPVKAQMFWASSANPTTLEPVEVELKLSADPVERCKQLISALILAVPSPAQRTLPADTTLSAFYLLPDGTAVADFSNALASETPSGILSEQMTVDSIVRTLDANVPQARRLKILIHGQEVETLAGHLDLTGFFPVHAEKPAAASAPSATAAGLTPPRSPGKLGR